MSPKLLLGRHPQPRIEEVRLPGDAFRLQFLWLAYGAPILPPDRAVDLCDRDLREVRARGGVDPKANGM